MADMRAGGKMRHASHLVRCIIRAAQLVRQVGLSRLEPGLTRMARLKHKLTEAPATPVRAGRAVTFALLLETAMQLIHSDGHVPSVAVVASRCQVPRATAYRYFANRSALITAIIDRSLGAVRQFKSDNPDGRARVHELFMQTFPRFKEFEPQMRAAVQLSLEQWALERAGVLEEEPYRRGHRVRILQHALAPLAAQMPAAVHLRLHRALSLVYGIEPYITLKDIWGISDREVERIALWSANALVDAALREAGVALAPRQGADGAAPKPLVPKPRVPKPRVLKPRVLKPRKAPRHS